MVGGTMTEKTRAAIWFFLNNGAAGRYRSRAKRIGRAKNSNYRKAHGSSNMHGSRVVSNKEMTVGEYGWQIGNGRFAGKIDRRLAQLSSDSPCDGGFECGSKEDDVRISLCL